jgi:FAD/FMN-containing dehydrogenase
VFEQLPAALWPVLAPSPVSSDLARRTRAAFDPHRLLNPGILGESPAT